MMKYNLYCMHDVCSQICFGKIRASCIKIGLISNMLTFWIGFRNNVKDFGRIMKTGKPKKS